MADVMETDGLNLDNARELLAASEGVLRSDSPGDVAALACALDYAEERGEQRLREQLAETQARCAKAVEIAVAAKAVVADRQKYSLHLEGDCTNPYCVLARALEGWAQPEGVGNE